MGNVAQLAFDFTYSVEPQPDHRPRISWRVSALAKRYRISPSHAQLYANEMRLPTEEAREW